MARTSTAMTNEMIIHPEVISQTVTSVSGKRHLEVGVVPPSLKLLASVTDQNADNK